MVSDIIIIIIESFFFWQVKGKKKSISVCLYLCVRERERESKSKRVSGLFILGQQNSIDYIDYNLFFRFAFDNGSFSFEQLSSLAFAVPTIPFSFP